MKLYLHTIDGKPAGFDKDLGQIYSASHNPLIEWKAKPVKDLETIKEQQKKTFEFRKKNGFRSCQFIYDYVIIEVDERDCR